MHNQTSRVATKASTLRGQSKKKEPNNKSTGPTGSRSGLTSTTGLTGAKTGLISSSSKSGDSSKTKNRIRTSFKELLAKYEKEGIAQKQKEQSNKIKDMKLSSKHQERLGQGNCTSFDGPVAPWCCYYQYFYMPMDYSRMHIQS